MAVFQSIMSNFGTFLMAIILTIIPYAGLELPVIDNKEDDCLMTVELISDTHVEEKELARQFMLTSALTNIKFAKAEQTLI